jgi:hypothetical protein
MKTKKGRGKVVAGKDAKCTSWYSIRSGDDRSSESLYVMEDRMQVTSIEQPTNSIDHARDRPVWMDWIERPVNWFGFPPPPSIIKK